MRFTFPEKVGNDSHLTFKGVNYDFVDGQKVDLGDAAKVLFFEIVPNLLNKDLFDGSRLSSKGYNIE